MGIVRSMYSSNIGQHNSISNLYDIANLNEARLYVVGSFGAICLPPTKGNRCFMLLEPYYIYCK